MPAGISRRLRMDALRVRIAAEAALADATAAAATATLVQNEASARPADNAAQQAAAYANGMVAVAKKDFAAARSAFDKCSEEDDICQSQRIIAMDRVDDAAAAATTRERWLRLYKRDPAYLVVRTMMKPSAQEERIIDPHDDEVHRQQSEVTNAHTTGSTGSTGTTMGLLQHAACGRCAELARREHAQGTSQLTELAASGSLR